MSDTANGASGSFVAPCASACAHHTARSCFFSFADFAQCRRLFGLRPLGGHGIVKIIVTPEKPSRDHKNQSKKAPASYDYRACALLFLQSPMIAFCSFCQPFANFERRCVLLAQHNNLSGCKYASRSCYYLIQRLV